MRQLLPLLNPMEEAEEVILAEEAGLVVEEERGSVVILEEEALSLAEEAGSVVQEAGILFAVEVPLIYF